MNSCTMGGMAEETGRYRTGGDEYPGGGRPGDEWATGRRVRRLRRHLGETQASFADRLGTNQQTVSEWETGARQPRRMAQRLLHLVAEQAGYYDASDIDRPDADADTGDDG